MKAQIEGCLADVVVNIEPCIKTKYWALVSASQMQEWLSLSWELNATRWDGNPN